MQFITNVLHILSNVTIFLAFLLLFVLVVKSTFSYLTWKRKFYK